MDLDAEKLDEGIGIQETLMIHSAKWHYGDLTGYKLWIIDVFLKLCG